MNCKHFLAAFVIFIICYCSFANAQPEITILNFFPCENPIENDALTVTFKDDASPPSADIVFETTMDLTGSDTADITVHKYVDGVWQNNIVETSDTLDKYIDSFLKKAFEKLRDQSDPKFEGYDLPAGKYVWNDFTLDKTDVVPPGGLDGHLKSEIIVYSDETPITCLGIEGLIEE